MTREILTPEQIGEAESDLIVDAEYFAEVDGRRLLESHEELRDQLKAAESRLAVLQGERDDYKEAYEDSKRLAREIGVALDGEGAAIQPSLCDLVMPVQRMREALARLTAEHEGLKVGESDRQSTEMAVTPHRVPPPMAELDPGIREMVGYLWANGFETSDSGDGVTKPEDERTFGSTPHVCAMTSPLMMVSEANRMAGLLGPEWRVEASYSPHESALLIATKQHSASRPTSTPETP